MDYFKPDKSGPWNPSSREINTLIEDTHTINEYRNSMCLMGLTMLEIAYNIDDSCFLANSLIDQLMTRIQEEDEKQKN